MTILVSGTLRVAPADRDRYLVHERWQSREHLLAFRASGGPEPDDGGVELLGADVLLHHVAASEAP